MRVAVLTPLPPSRTGIAHYSSMLVPALGARAFDSLDGYRRADFDHVVYQLGNNPHHEWIYREALREPGVIVLHDLVLHHLIVEMTLARGDAEGYVAALERSHGAAGAAWARGRAAGLHSEMGNFLLPASIDIAERSRGVIVHNHYAAARLRSFGVTTPVHVVPHPYVPAEILGEAKDQRSPSEDPGDEAVTIGFFGFLTSAKRAEVVLEAFRIARQREPRLQLLIVGEPAPNIDISTILGEGVTATGYVDDDQFGAYYAKVDRLVNLRYPSAGETSGTLIRAFDAGKPVAVSNYAQFAELPDDCVVKVPLGDGEVEALVDFFLRDFDVPAIARAQRQWLEANATLEKAVDGYRHALSCSGCEASHGGGRAAGELQLFPRLAVVDTHVDGDRLMLTLRNDGDATLRTRSYGMPGYRLLVKLFDEGQVVQDRWLELPGDVAPGGTIDVSMRMERPASSARLYDALEGIPMLEPEAWGEVTVVR